MHRRTTGLGELLLGAVVAALMVWPAASQQTPLTKIQYVVSAPQPTQARSHHRHRSTARSMAPQRQIACTILGCNPVPPGCHPEPQRTFSGMTTGFDAVVCP
jgi:hypothetical protein